MKLRIKRGLAAMAAIAVTALTLPALSQAAALEQFKAFVAKTKSARGDFTQRMVKEEGGKLRTSSASSGNFLFARPGKFIWTYQKPYEQVLQADGEKLYIYDKDLNQFGQISLLSFTRFEKNPALPATQFRFTVPKGADILQQ